MYFSRTDVSVAHQATLDFTKPMESAHRVNPVHNISEDFYLRRELDGLVTWCCQISNAATVDQLNPLLCKRIENVMNRQVVSHYLVYRPVLEDSVCKN